MNPYPANTQTVRSEPDKTPLLQLLLEAQSANRQRYITESDINKIAQMLHVSRGRVYSTASFYSEISLSPRGIHLIRVCINAPCENAGKEEIIQTLVKELGVEIGQTTTDGLFTLESVNCLGACYMSPAIKVDDTIYGNLTPDKVLSMIHTLREEHHNEHISE